MNFFKLFSFDVIIANFSAKMSVDADKDHDKRPGNGTSYEFARKRHKSDEPKSLADDEHEQNQSPEV